MVAARWKTENKNSEFWEKELKEENIRKFKDSITTYIYFYVFYEILNFL